MENTTDTYTDSVQEFSDLLVIARSRVDDEDWTAERKEACARRMVEAYYHGRMDRQRIDREIAAREQVAA